MRRSLYQRLVLTAAGFVLLAGVGLGYWQRTKTTPVAYPPYVFIHGIKGSALVAPDGARVWLNAGQALGLDTPKLSLPIEWDGNDRQRRDDLRSGEILRRLLIFPFFADERIYGPWLEATAAAVSPFAYDWRRDNAESVDRFEAHLIDWQKRHDGARARVVAHSMGGLITIALMNRRPELFDKVVLVGVPVQGGVGFLKDLHVGASIGLNDEILSPEVLGTFPSVYSLFPLVGTGLADDQGLPLEMDFYSAKKWRELGLGLYGDGRSAATERDNPAAFSAHLERAIERARAFRESATFKKGGAYPPILVVRSVKHPTLAEVRRGGPKAVRGWDFETAKRAAGDGRIPASSALPKAGVKYELFESDYSHSELLNDPTVIERIRQFW